jgi:KDO2-lipid IV(A) lauroyltransferase
MPRLTPEWIGRHCDYGDRERLLGPAREGRGALVAVPHAGNWDLAGVVLRRLGVPFFFIARRQKNLLADAYLNRLRAATGAETIANDAHLLRGVLRRLRDGGYLGILPDVRARTPGLAVRFLGGTANAGSGMARFARHTGAPVFPCLPGREGWTRHRFRVLDPVAPDPAADPAADALRMTQEVLDRFDRYIRENPEQYFWFNKRWVLDPLDAGAPPADAAEP